MPPDPNPTNPAKGTAEHVDQARPVRDCTHPRAQHVHGTRAAYVKDRCRCPACTTANSEASRTVRRRRAYRRWQPLTTPNPPEDNTPTRS